MLLYFDLPASLPTSNDMLLLLRFTPPQVQRVGKGDYRAQRHGCSSSGQGGTLGTYSLGGHYR